MNNFKSNTELGKKYVHKYSGISGIAMAVYFYLHGCERVAILPEDSKTNEWLNFDADELEGIETDDLGGPKNDNPQSFNC